MSGFEGNRNPNSNLVSLTERFRRAARPMPPLIRPNSSFLTNQNPGASGFLPPSQNQIHGNGNTVGYRGVDNMTSSSTQMENSNMGASGFLHSNSNQGNGNFVGFIGMNNMTNSFNPMENPNIGSSRYFHSNPSQGNENSTGFIGMNNMTNSFNPMENPNIGSSRFLHPNPSQEYENIAGAGSSGTNMSSSNPLEIYTEHLVLHGTSSSFFSAAGTVNQIQNQNRYPITYNNSIGHDAYGNPQSASNWVPNNYPQVFTPGFYFGNNETLIPLLPTQNIQVHENNNSRSSRRIQSLREWIVSHRQEIESMINPPEGNAAGQVQVPRVAPQHRNLIVTGVSMLKDENSLLDNGDGKLCHYCKKDVLSESKPEKRKNHIATCKKKQFGKFRVLLKKRGSTLTCGICFDVVQDKKGGEDGEPFFGILSNCSHIFCSKCIYQWRDPQPVAPRRVTVENLIEGRTFDELFGDRVGPTTTSHRQKCPMCRKRSDLVCPCAFWIEEPWFKERIFTEYKATLRTIECPYEKRDLLGVCLSSCPFGQNCLYKHNALAEARPL